MGLPLTTRGTQILILCDISIYRITPAYAGNTGCICCQSAPPQDHPRLHGEHSFLIYPRYLTPGSPPPTRGTLSPCYNTVTEHRITPAYAGNTILFLLCSSFARDHPRLRGEHYTRESNLSHVTGSPPPTQGTPIINGETRYRDRITPSYAGNTLIGGKLDRAFRDHPRLRREHYLRYFEM